MRRKILEFNPYVKSSSPPESLSFAKAKESHIQEVFELSLLRNPNIDKEKLYENTEKEIMRYSNGVNYGLYRALLSEKVLFFLAIALYSISLK